MVKRRLVVTANVRGRDLGSFVDDVACAVGNELDIPSGYWVEYGGGTYQKLQSASQRLMIVVPVTLLMIVGLLALALNSVRDALVRFWTGVPLALTGGVLALTVRDIPFFDFCGRRFIALGYRHSERISDGVVYPGIAALWPKH